MNGQTTNDPRTQPGGLSGRERLAYFMIGLMISCLALGLYFDARARAKRAYQAQLEAARSGTANQP